MQKQNHRQLAAFTILESLVTLMVISAITILMNSSVIPIFQKVEESLFFMTFEQVYQETQRLSASQQKSHELRITSDFIQNSLGKYNIPNGIRPEKVTTIVFNDAGGNSSLETIRFQTAKGKVTYQLYLGSGQYQKK